MHDMIERLLLQGRNIQVVEWCSNAGEWEDCNKLLVYACQDRTAQLVHDRIETALVVHDRTERQCQCRVRRDRLQNGAVLPVHDYHQLRKIVEPGRDKRKASCKTVFYLIFPFPALPRPPRQEKRLRFPLLMA